jgi:hypothetical protein
VWYAEYLLQFLTDGVDTNDEGADEVEGDEALNHLQGDLRRDR